MVCKPARVSRPMNGAVFHTSAITIAQNEAPVSANQRISWPRILFITPEESKISFHISAETMVGIAHGTKMPARTTPRPLKALAMMSAIATPSTVSSSTQTIVIIVVLRKAFQKRSMLPQVPSTTLAPEKIALKFSKPTNCSPPATMPVVGSTPEFVAKNDSRIDMSTGIPATTRMMMRVGASNNQASRPCPSLRAFFLCLWPSSVAAGTFRASAVAVAIRLTSSCEMHRVPGSTVAEPGTRGGQLLLDQSLQLALQGLQGRVWSSLTLKCTIGSILDRQCDITILDGLRPRLGGLDRLKQDRVHRVLLKQVCIGVQLLEGGGGGGGHSVRLLDLRR